MRESHIALGAGELLLPPAVSQESGMALWTTLWVDPGGTTGWCVLSIHEEAMRSTEYRILENVAHWSAGELAGSIESQIDKLIDLVDAWEDAEVGFESFHLRQLRGGPELLDPVRITTPVKWWLEVGGKRVGDPDWLPRTVHFQQPALAMTTITDNILKAAGVLHLTAGKPHARDAMRHALTFARRTKKIMEEQRRYEPEQGADGGTQHPDRAGRAVHAGTPST